MYLARVCAKLENINKENLFSFSQNLGHYCSVSKAHTLLYSSTKVI